MEKIKMHTPNFTDEKQDYGVLRGGGLQGLIHTFRGMQVMFDRDLAELYGVPVKRLNEQVKRNEDRFPEPFRFQLTREELEAGALRSQIATLENGRGKHRKYMPYVFTEQGVAMLSAVLRSETAVKTSVSIMNAFVGMRRFLMIDDAVYHIGASMKDLGKRWFAFSKMDQTGLKVVEKIRDHEAVAEESE